MKQFLKNFTTAPPGGWRYTQEGTCLKQDARDYLSLCFDVTQHRQYKKLDRSTIIEVMDDVEEQLIEGMTEDMRLNYCTDKEHCSSRHGRR